MSNTSKSKRVKQASKKKIVQIHGKVEGSEFKRTPSSLDEILGESLSIYTVTNSDDYRNQLVELNMTDLQSHAYKVGLVPAEDRKLLTDRLVEEFKKVTSKYHGKGPSSNVDLLQDLDSEALKILREGA